MTGLLDRILDYLADYVTDGIVVEKYDLGLAGFTAGAVGSTAKTQQVAIAKTGYEPVTLAVGFASTNVIRFVGFWNQDRTSAYVQTIRGQTSAFSTTIHVYLYVTYKKIA